MISDKDWEKLKVRHQVDVWTSRLAWAVFACCLTVAAGALLIANLNIALLGLILAAVSAAVARWHPALIKIDDDRQNMT